MNDIKDTLTATEKAYYDALLAFPHGVAREYLLNLGKKNETYARTSNVVDAQIRNLRAKMRRYGSPYEIIMIRGFGYQFRQHV